MLFSARRRMPSSNTTDTRPNRCKASSASPCLWPLHSESFPHHQQPHDNQAYLQHLITSRRTIRQAGGHCLDVKYPGLSYKQSAPFDDLRTITPRMPDPVPCSLISRFPLWSPLHHHIAATITMIQKRRYMNFTFPFSSQAIKVRILGADRYNNRFYLACRGHNIGTLLRFRSRPRACATAHRSFTSHVADLAT